MKIPNNIMHPKSATVTMEFPIHMQRDEVERYCEEVAKKLAEEVRKEIMDKIGPNWFYCSDGWRTGHDFIHEPGLYRMEVVFAVNNEILKAGITV